jgi:hypothetical protein
MKVSIVRGLKLCDFDVSALIIRVGEIPEEGIFNILSK